jgi:signal transduction histidine kinase
VVEDFLRFARPAPVERGRFDVNEALREVLTLTRQPALKNGVHTELVAGAVPPLPGDREQLKQAFLNLVLNALQAMPDGGTLTVVTEAAEGQLRIRFADTGQGIPQENLERIFNPFFTTRQEGTGLGLAITHRIIQGHGGRIEVQSLLGAGTTFTVVLPLVEGP